MARLRIATWNINSLRLRFGLLERLVAALDPDVICLQETKVPDDLFPAHLFLEGAPAGIGYPHVARRGMKGYNGVAILSRLPLRPNPDAPDWCERGDCRHLEAAVLLPDGLEVTVHNFYVPAGGDIPDRTLNPKFGHKLDFVAEATRWFGARRIDRCVLVGDLNIAPMEHDVWSHRQLLTVVSHTPVEVAMLTDWQNTQFVDALRHFVPADQKLYTWWSYRNQDWRKSNRGRRLDHVWITPDLLPGLVQHEVLVDARDWPRTSDHVPVCIELDV